MSQNLIGAIVSANRTRKNFAADEVVLRVMDLVCAGVKGSLGCVERYGKSDYGARLREVAEGRVLPDRHFDCTRQR